MTIAENLQDVERHAGDFRLRKGFTYTVLDATNDVIGCIYIYPSRDKHSGAQIHSWIRADRPDLDIALYDSRQHVATHRLALPLDRVRESNLRVTPTTVGDAYRTADLAHALLRQSACIEEPKRAL